MSINVQYIPSEVKLLFVKDQSEFLLTPVHINYA